MKGVKTMGAYIMDLTIVALLIVGITALMGVITNGFGEKLFGGKNRSEFVDESAKYQTGWKTVGGNKKK
jgi:amino acid transporter